MVIIAHRGNTTGPNSETENLPSHIDRIYHQYGFHSEIDLWRVYDKATGPSLFLGHDYPQHQVDSDWLRMRSNILWIHCKNIEALAMFQNHPYGKDFNYFWHEEDAYTLTSKGWIWAYPGKKVPDNGPFKSIAVMPEVTGMSHKDLICFNGVCTDYGVNYL